jgi:hypothetical protein
MISLAGRMSLVSSPVRIAADIAVSVNHLQ